MVTPLMERWGKQEAKLEELVDEMEQLVAVLIEGSGRLGETDDELRQLVAVSHPQALRLELRRALIGLVKTKTCAEDAVAVGRVWRALGSLFEGFEEEVHVLMAQDLYPLIPAIKDGLTCLPDQSEALDCLLNGATAVLGVLEHERGAAMFGVGTGWRHGMEIVSHCVSHLETDTCGRFVSQISNLMAEFVKKKLNVSGAYDQLRRTLLVPLIRFCTSCETPQTDVLKNLVVQTLFHGSMEKQYQQYLAIHEESICLGTEIISASEKCPTVQPFFNALAAEVIKHPQSAEILPFLVEAFLSRQGSELGHHASELSANRSGFLIAAKCCSIVLKLSALDSGAIAVLFEILELIHKHVLYQPTLDEGFLQLQFLQHLSQTCLTEGKATSPQKKKRRLDKALKSQMAASKLKICGALLEIEHRALTPVVNKVFALFSKVHKPSASLPLLLKLMQKFAAVRKWTLIFTTMIKTHLSASLSELLLDSSVLEAVQDLTRRLTSLEVQEFMESIIQELRQNCMNLWDPKDTTRTMLHLLEAVVTSVPIQEINAVPISNCLSGLAPTFDTLASFRDSPLFLELLKLSYQIGVRMEACMALHPLASSENFLSSFAIESILSVEQILAEDSVECVVECLLKRLNFVHHQSVKNQFSDQMDEENLTGEAVTKTILVVLDHLTDKDAVRLQSEILSAYFHPWVAGCTSECLIDFFVGAIRHLDATLADFERLFEEPVAYADQKFRHCWCTAFFKVLSRLVSDVPHQELLISVVSKQTSPPMVCKDVRKMLIHQLESNFEAFKGLQSEGLMDLLLFGLKLPVFFFGPDRWRLEMCVTILSTVSSDPRLLDCISRFSLESIQTMASDFADYLITAVYWIFHFCKRLYAVQTEDTLQKTDAALFAVMKQLFFSQWSRGNITFFNTSVKIAVKNKPWKMKTLNAACLFDALSSQDETKTWCFDISAVGVFVHLCKKLCIVHCEKSLDCIKGPTPPQWTARMYKQLKTQNTIPDFDQIPIFLQETVFPVIQKWFKVRALKLEATQRACSLGTAAGIVADLLEISCKDPIIDVRDVSFQVLLRIKKLAKGTDWNSVPPRLDRMAHFLHNVCVLMDTKSEDLKIRMMDLLLELFIRAMEFHQRIPDAQDQPFLLSAPGSEIVLKGLENKSPGQKALLNAFQNFLTVDDESIHGFENVLLMKLQESQSLESKFGTLQFLLACLYQQRQQLRASKSKLPGRVLDITYQCFWDGYVRHLLLTLVDRKRRKTVRMPQEHQRGLFSGLLCGFFRCFSLCHSLACPLSQRITIQINKRIKRIVQALSKKAFYGDLTVAASWFGEMCAFLIAAVRLQKTVQAAQALFPSFRAATESLLSVLLVWELETGERTPVIEKAEANLGAVYSEAAGCRNFAQGLPDLLFSFLLTMDTLRSKNFTRNNPLQSFFKLHPSGINPNHKLVPKVKRRVAQVHAALTPSQLKDLQSQIAPYAHLTSQLDWFANWNGRFTGHDG